MALITGAVVFTSSATGASPQAPAVTPQLRLVSGLAPTGGTAAVLARASVPNRSADHVKDHPATHHARPHKAKHHPIEHHTTKHDPSTAPRGARILRAAASKAGDPYVYGAAGPNAFDCSGLTSYVYRVAAGVYLPHSASGQQAYTRPESGAAAQPGDLVFFHDGGGVYHVAIYAGGHMVWHAPHTGTEVRKERIWTSAVTYGRVR